MWSLASCVTIRSICCARSCSRTRASSRSTIWRISSTESERKTTSESTRFRNSGRNCVLSCSRTFSFIRSYCASRSWSPRRRDRAEAERRVLEQVLGADVAGHDDDRVAEVDPATLRVGQVPVLEDLEEHVEDLGMGLLDLVEQHHRVALPAHGLGQLAALLEADVAGRRAHEAAHVVALHELAHVDLDERVLAAEHELGERLRELRLADAGGAQEDERADRSLGILQAGARAADGPRDGVDRLLLPDDTLVERVLHLEQALGLLLRDARHGDAGPERDDLGDVLLGDVRRHRGHLGLPVAAQLVDLGARRGLGVAQLLRALVVLVVDRRLLLLA